jgi:gliding motility-associated-like protein
VPSGEHKVYVRDKNGCGIAEGLVERELAEDDFPKFFTPNGDGVNDFWQLQPSKEGRRIQLEYLQVFDRYGVLLAQVTQSSPGWDGNFNGRPVPSSVYWFKAADNYKNIIRGYFLLKR